VGLLLRHRSCHLCRIRDDVFPPYLLAQRIAPRRSVTVFSSALCASSVSVRDKLEAPHNSCIQDEDVLAVCMPDTERATALRAELQRLSKLPPNSAYAQHRIAVCTRALELVQTPSRSVAEADELEKLLSGLSL